MPARTINIAGGNNITLSTATVANATSFTISGPNTHAQQTAISGLANAETTYTSGTVSLSALANITIRSTTGNQFQFSVAPAQTVQTQNMVAVSATNTLYSSGTVLFTGSNMITVKSSAAGQTIILDATQSVQTQGVTADELSIGVSTGGNTAGNTTVQTGQRMVFVGTDGISLSQGTGAGSTTVSIRDMFSTATTVSSVSNANAVGANNSRYAMEAHIHEGLRRIGVSSDGHTAGSTTVVPGSAVELVGTNGLTLSQSSDTNSNITVSFVPPRMSIYMANSAALQSSSSGNMVNTSVSIMRFQLENALSFSRVDIPISVSLNTSATTNTAAVDMSWVAQILTRNASTLSPIVGQSSTTTYTWASNSGAFSSLTGLRVMSFNLATFLTPGEYYLALQGSSHSGSSIGLSTTALSLTWAPLWGTSLSSVAGFNNLSAATDATYNFLRPLQGMNSVSLSNTTMTHQGSQITQTGVGVSANLIAHLKNVN